MVQPVCPVAQLPDPPPTMPSERDLQYYYFGFYTVLKRYRLMVLIGWSAVATACGGIIIGWEYGMVHGLVDIAISVCAVAAGLALVHQSVAGLSQYLAIPFTGDEGEPDAALEEIRTVMKDVTDGGWQEAFAAMHILEQMHERCGLPPLR
jgi:hypothetical protein